MRIINKFLWNSWISLKRFNHSKPLPLENLDRKAVKNILVVSCTALGDTLLSTPAIHATRRLFPDSRISLLVKRAYETLFSSNPDIDETIPYHGGYRRPFYLVREFQKRDFSLCISLHDSDPCPVQAAWLAEIPFILRNGSKDRALIPFLSKRTPHRKDIHTIEQRLDVLRLIDPDHVDTYPAYNRMIMPVKPAASHKLWGKIFSEHNLHHLDLQDTLKIGFQISASKPYTVWPPENFAQLAAQTVSKHKNTAIFLFGGPGDYKLGGRIRDMAGGGKRIINLAGKIEIDNLHLAIEGLDLLVTNDTGPMHLAIAVQTPVIALFVPSVVKHTGPYQDMHLHTVINKKRPCSPCTRKYCKDPHCMSLITTDEVYQAVEETLNKGKVAHHE